MGTLDPAWAGIIQVNLAKPDPPFNIPMGTVADNIIFHLSDFQPGMIAMTDSQIPGLGTVLDSVPFQEVPEPVTLALLALASISMRRRKRLAENLAVNAKPSLVVCSS